MAFVEDQDDEEKGQGTGTTVQQPQQVGQQTGQPQETGGQGAFIGGGQQTPQQQQESSSSGKSKGSGLFTDVRKYVQANKPQAGRIAGAVTGNIQDQAQRIQQGLAQKSKSFQDRIAEQRARLGQAQAFGQQAIQQAGQGQAPQDASRFRNIATGQQQFNVGDTLNTSQAKLQSQRLAKQAALAERARGTGQLLQQTFGEGQQRYTRGQRGLDELILGGNRGIRSGLVDTAQQAAEGVQGQLRAARQAALQGRSRLQEEGQQLRQQLGQQLTGAREGLQQEIQADVESQRQALAQRQADFEQALSSGQLTREELLNFVPQEEADRLAQAYEDRKALFERRLRGQSGGLQSALGGLGQSGIFNNILSPILSQARSFDDLTRTANPILNEQRRQFLEKGIERLGDYGVSGEDFFQAVQRVRPAFEEQGRQEAVRAANEGRGGSARISLGNADKLIGQELADLIAKAPTQSGETLLNEIIDRANTQKRRDLGGFLSKTPLEQIQAGNIVTDEQLARQASLAKLAGLEGEGVQRFGAVPTSPGQLDALSTLKRLGYKLV